MSERETTVPAGDTSIFCDVRGSGPPLLVVQGGLGEAGATAGFADALAGTHTVISYDRRGISRSPAGPGVDIPVTIDRHADDAAAVLAALAAGPAVVVGASIGALIALHLAVRWPDDVRLVVAHEPPMESLVPDPETSAELDAIQTLARDDPTAAIRRMAALTGGSDTAEPDARPARPVGDVAANLRRFFAHDFPAVRSSTLDPQRIVDTCGADRVVPTGGTDSRGRWEYRCAQRLAAELGRELVELPGGHNGLVGHPRGSADALRTLLS